LTVRFRAAAIRSGLTPFCTAFVIICVRQSDLADYNASIVCEALIVAGNDAFSFSVAEFLQREDPQMPIQQ